jgi:diguanylate cyclase (GGDEF)-like protein
VSRVITKLIGMVNTAASPPQTEPGSDALQKGNREHPEHDDLPVSEQEKTADTADNTLPGSEAPGMDLAGNEHPAISDLAAVADEFNAAFNTALYELDSSRKQLAERSIRIDELNKSIKTINSTLNDEVNKGRGKEEEKSREAEQLNQKINDIESDRERLLQQVEEVTATLEQRTAEGQHAQEELVRERDMLTGKLDELQVLFDVAGNQLEAHQNKLEDRDNEISGISKQLDSLTTELASMVETSDREKDANNQEVARLEAAIRDLNENLQAREQQLEQRSEELELKGKEAACLNDHINELKEELDAQAESLRAQSESHAGTCDELNGQISQLKEEVDTKAESLRTQSESHAGTCNELNEQINSISSELESLRTAYSELGTHAENLENLNRALHESSISENTLHKKLMEEKSNKIELLQTKLGSGDESQNDQPENTEANEGLQRALNDLESRLQETEAQKQVLGERAGLADKLEAEAGQLRAALQEARETGSTDVQSLQGELADLNSALENSRAEQEVLAGKLRDHEALEQKATSDLESRLQEAEAQKQVLGERARLVDELEAEAGQLRAALQEAREAGSADEQSLQDQLADLNSALENSRAEQETLAGKLHDHEALEKEVTSLREAVQQADNKLLEQVDVSNIVDSLKDEVKKLKSTLSASEEMREQLQSSLPGVSPSDGPGVRDTSAPEQDAQPVQKIADRDQFTLHLNKLITGQVDTEIISNVMYLLIDHFIRIRDEIGIMNSAHVINEIGEILVSSCDDDDTVSRFGDCTFAVLTCNESTDETQAKAEKIRSTIEKHIFETPGHSMVVSTSIGICMVRKNDTCADNVISRADLACESARSSGGNQVVVNSAIADEMVIRSSAGNHEELISKTLTENRIMLYYQPISCLKDIPGNHYEVLIRIVDESGGVILPGEFFSMAGTSGQTADIDRYVIEKIMQMISENRDQEMTLFIKLTSQSVADHELPLWIIEKIKEYEVDPGQLVFEMAESTLQSDLKNLSMLSKALNSIGCKIAIEHYRMSTQPQHLLHIHADYLKIDSGLVEGLSRNGGSHSKVTAIMDLAREHNYITIAEGVENPASLAILWELGVGLAQGYFIQAPTGSRDYNFQGIVEESEKHEDGNAATFELG